MRHPWSTTPTSPGTSRRAWRGSGSSTQSQGPLAIVTGEDEAGFTAWVNATVGDAVNSLQWTSPWGLTRLSVAGADVIGDVRHDRVRAGEQPELEPQGGLVVQ